MDVYPQYNCYTKLTPFLRVLLLFVSFRFAALLTMVYGSCFLPILESAFLLTAAASPKELTGQIVPGAWIVELAESHVDDWILYCFVIN
jgi:hypothetical protein